MSMATLIDGFQCSNHSRCDIQYAHCQQIHNASMTVDNIRGFSAIFASQAGALQTERRKTEDLLTVKTHRFELDVHMNHGLLNTSTC